MKIIKFFIIIISSQVFASETYSEVSAAGGGARAARALNHSFSYYSLEPQEIAGLEAGEFIDRLYQHERGAEAAPSISFSPEAIKAFQDKCIANNLKLHSISAKDSQCGYRAFIEYLNRTGQREKLSVTVTSEAELQNFIKINSARLGIAKSYLEIADIRTLCTSVEDENILATSIDHLPADNSLFILNVLGHHWILAERVDPLAAAAEVAAELGGSAGEAEGLFAKLCRISKEGKLSTEGYTELKGSNSEFDLLKLLVTKLTQEELRKSVSVNLIKRVLITINMNLAQKIYTQALVREISNFIYQSSLPEQYRNAVSILQTSLTKKYHLLARQEWNKRTLSVQVGASLEGFGFFRDLPPAGKHLCTEYVVEKIRSRTFIEKLLEDSYIPKDIDLDEYAQKKLEELQHDISGLDNIIRESFSLAVAEDVKSEYRVKKIELGRERRLFLAHPSNKKFPYIFFNLNRSNTKDHKAYKYREGIEDHIKQNLKSGSWQRHIAKKLTILKTRVIIPELKVEKEAFKKELERHIERSRQSSVSSLSSGSESSLEASSLWQELSSILRDAREHSVYSRDPEGIAQRYKEFCKKEKAREQEFIKSPKRGAVTKAKKEIEAIMSAGGPKALAIAKREENELKAREVRAAAALRAQAVVGYATEETDASIDPVLLAKQNAAAAASAAAIFAQSQAKRASFFVSQAEARERAKQEKEEEKRRKAKAKATKEKRRQIEQAVKKQQRINFLKENLKKEKFHRIEKADIPLILSFLDDHDDVLLYNSLGYLCAFSRQSPRVVFDAIEEGEDFFIERIKNSLNRITDAKIQLNFLSFISSFYEDYYKGKKAKLFVRKLGRALIKDIMSTIADGRGNKLKIMTLYAFIEYTEDNRVFFQEHYLGSFVSMSPGLIEEDSSVAFGLLLVVELTVPRKIHKVILINILKILYTKADIQALSALTTKYIPLLRSNLDETRAAGYIITEEEGERESYRYTVDEDGMFCITYIKQAT
jgi:hypothetical protein